VSWPHVRGYPGVRFARGQQGERDVADLSLNPNPRNIPPFVLWQYVASIEA